MVIRINSQLKKQKNRKEDELEDIPSITKLFSFCGSLEIAIWWYVICLYLAFLPFISMLDPLTSPLLSLNSPSCVEWILSVSTDSVECPFEIKQKAI